MENKGKRGLSDEQKEERRLEKEARFAGRGKYNLKKNQSDTEDQNKSTQSNMDNNGENNEVTGTNQVANTDSINTGEVANTTPVVKTDEVKTTVPDPKVETKTTPTNTTYQPNKSWKPLGGDRMKRDYSTPVIDQNLLNQEIPEINVGPQNVTTQSNVETLNKPITEAVATSGAAKPAGPEPIKPIVENWNQMTPDEQKNAAAQTTDMILGVYDKLHMFGRMYIKKDHDELVEAHNDDKIDMYDTVTENEEDPDKEITIEEFWGDYNNQIEERFIVSQTFKDAVRPPMERLCMKYGLGASDGLFLAYKFGEDAATKLAMLVGFKKTVAKMDQTFEKKHERFKKQVQAEVDRMEAVRTAAEKKMNEKNKTTETTSTKKETPDITQGDKKTDVIITEENKHEKKD